MPELRRWFGWAVELPPVAEVQRWCEAAPGDWERGDAHHFSILEDGDLVGSVGIESRGGRSSTQSAISYWTRSDRHRRGYATEAATAVVEFGFREVGLERIELVAGVANTGSIRVAEKLGFRREGLLRSARMAAEGRYHCFLFSRLSSDPAAQLPPVPRSEPDFASGLVTAVVQDDADGTVLMVAAMDPEAYRRTLESGRAWFWSRSRGELWEKGATSGNYMDVQSVSVDCDRDAVLLRVRPQGPACHTGERSCFDTPLPA